MRTLNSIAVPSCMMERTLTISEKLCHLCTFESLSVSGILGHLRRIHSSDPHFIVRCGLDGCASTFRSFSASYSHIYRHHPGVIKKRDRVEASKPTQYPIEDGNEAENDATIIDSSDISYLLGSDAEEVQRSSALFLLKLKEEHRISQVAIDNIVEDSRGLFFQVMERVQAGVRAKLAEAGLDHTSIDGLESVYENVLDPFDGIHTCYLQEKYFIDKLDLIEPREIKIGESRYTTQFSGTKRHLTKKWDTYQYVPLLSSLCRLLKDSTVLEQVEQCPHRIKNNDLIEDFCDGTRFSNHFLFSQDPYALQILAYYDELEVCNPLGSHVKKNKLGIVFYTLGNISPKYRSQLRLINLALIATVPIVEKYGLNKILEPFIADLNTLSTAGISVSICGVPRIFKGALLAFLADNLASNDLGGFKKSFSFSFRSCRTCLVTRDTLSSSFTSNAFDMRKESSHLKHIEMLDGSTATSDHYSKTYGINKRSSLMDIKYFSMFGGGLPHDAMHDIFEGIAPIEIKFLLLYYIENKFFCLDEYNDRLINFNYGYSEKSDKPIPILNRTLRAYGKSLRSTAAQMILLVRILPFLIGDKVPEGDEHWTCFLLLRKIVDIILCPVVSEALCSSLKLLIIEHHSKFVSLYGDDTYIPKMHFLIHYPEQMQAIGPMVRSWTLRHEAKLNFFKKASSLSNFKNISLSLANHHQRWMCYVLASNKLVHFPLECGPIKKGSGGLRSVKNEANDIQDCLIQILPGINLEDTIFRPTWVYTNGVRYQNNNAYIIVHSDGLDPVFGRLDDLLIVGKCTIVFSVSLCKVLYFDDHYHAYVISVTKHQVLFCDILDHNIYHGHKLSNNLTYISLKYLFL